MVGGSDEEVWKLFYPDMEFIWCMFVRLQPQNGLKHGPKEQATLSNNSPAGTMKVKVIQMLKMKVLMFL